MKHYRKIHIIGINGTICGRMGLLGGYFTDSLTANNLLKENKLDPNIFCKNCIRILLKKIKKQQLYLVGIDLAKKPDYSAMVVFEKLSNGNLKLVRSIIK